MPRTARAVRVGVVYHVLNRGNGRGGPPTWLGLAHTLRGPGRPRTAKQPAVLADNQ